MQAFEGPAALRIGEIWQGRRHLGGFPILLLLRSNGGFEALHGCVALALCRGARVGGFCRGRSVVLRQYRARCEAHGGQEERALKA
ncbi:hypothetical protein [Novosphingobium album (ex Liu et al. 2023)]|uniref:Uncharacterized protein n=1 Tax=Novosphingobium album (ex Liu et al. 2023) TaxID=3031130 RepID=A0ABT5WX70_9SPHN|nr:hypothetical protein [Novosphingobium album (ex Liu et al. 2023)]MDE8654467.1 hypothetical protein [Novosphingobium album (ex Liu et al. 2023)]